MRVVERRLQALLRQPYFSSSAGGATERVQELQQHFRFSLQYLMQSGTFGAVALVTTPSLIFPHSSLLPGLMDQSGKPTGVAGLAARLNFQQPGNFLLCELISAGVLHAVCRRFRPSSPLVSDRVAAELLLLLSHIFLVVPVAGSATVLPPLPHDAQAVVDTANKRALRCFEGFADAVLNR